MRTTGNHNPVMLSVSISKSKNSHVSPQPIGLGIVPLCDCSLLGEMCVTHSRFDWGDLLSDTWKFSFLPPEAQSSLDCTREAEGGAISFLECVGSLGLAGSRPRVVSPHRMCHLASPSPVWSISNRQRMRRNSAPACGGKRGR